MTREQILTKAIEATTGQREHDYGTPEDNFSIIAELWNVYLYEKLTGTLSNVDVANMMILFKVARNATGNPTNDNFIDIAGYAACGAECAKIDDIDDTDEKEEYAIRVTSSYDDFKKIKDQALKTFINTNDQFVNKQQEW